MDSSSDAASSRRSGISQASRTAALSFSQRVSHSVAVLRSSMDQAARKMRTRVGLAILGKEFASSHQSRLFHSDIGGGGGGGFETDSTVNFADATTIGISPRRTVNAREDGGNNLTAPIGPQTQPSSEGAAARLELHDEFFTSTQSVESLMGAAAYSARRQDGDAKMRHETEKKKIGVQKDEWTSEIQAGHGPPQPSFKDDAGAADESDGLRLSGNQQVHVPPQASVGRSAGVASGNRQLRFEGVEEHAGSSVSYKPWQGTPATAVSIESSTSRLRSRLRLTPRIKTPTFDGVSPATHELLRAEVLSTPKSLFETPRSERQDRKFSEARYGSGSAATQSFLDLSERAPTSPTSMTPGTPRPRNQSYSTDDAETRQVMYKSSGMLEAVRTQHNVAESDPGDVAMQQDAAVELANAVRYKYGPLFHIDWRGARNHEHPMFVTFKAINPVTGMAQLIADRTEKERSYTYGEEVPLSQIYAPAQWQSVSDDDQPLSRILANNTELMRTWMTRLQGHGLEPRAASPASEHNADTESQAQNTDGASQYSYDPDWKRKGTEKNPLTSMYSKMLNKDSFGIFKGKFDLLGSEPTDNPGMFLANAKLVLKNAQVPPAQWVSVVFNYLSPSLKSELLQAVTPATMTSGYDDIASTDTKVTDITNISWEEFCKWLVFTARKSYTLDDARRALKALKQGDGEMAVYIQRYNNLLREIADLGKKMGYSSPEEQFEYKQWFVLGCEYNTRMKIEVQLTLHRVDNAMAHFPKNQSMIKVLTETKEPLNEVSLFELQTLANLIWTDIRQANSMRSSAATAENKRASTPFPRLTDGTNSHRYPASRYRADSRSKFRMHNVEELEDDATSWQDAQVMFTRLHEEGRIPPWSKEQKQILYERKLCFRCGEANHQVKDCKKEPANPKAFNLSHSEMNSHIEEDFDDDEDAGADEPLN